jgi:paired amphipathic helix protein Sin3a
MDEMALKQRWQYYISSYIRVEPTEGIPRDRLQKVVITRNLPNSEANSEDGTIPKPLSYAEGLGMKICLNTSKIFWAKETSEFFIYDRAPKTAPERKRHAFVLKARSAYRESKFTEKMVHNNAWMKDKSQEEVQNINAGFQKWMKEGVVPEVSEQTEKADGVA